MSSRTTRRTVLRTFSLIGTGAILSACIPRREAVLSGTATTQLKSESTQPSETRTVAPTVGINPDILVIYDSVFGNTEQIAQAMGEETGGTMRRVIDVKLADLREVKTLVIGSPTRAFNALPSITNFLKGLPAGSLTGMRVAAFDTRFSAAALAKTPGFLHFLIGIFGYASEKIAKGLVKAGGTLAVEPAWFGVEASEGPLTVGELERAAAWAESLHA